MPFGPEDDEPKARNGMLISIYKVLSCTLAPL